MNTLFQIILATFLLSVVASAKATCWHCGHDHDEYALEDHDHDFTQDVTNITNVNGVDQATVNGLVDDLRGGIAVAGAMAMVPDIPTGKKMSIGGGIAGYDDELAGAIGIKGEHENMKIDATISSAKGSKPIVGLGMGWGW